MTPQTECPRLNTINFITSIAVKYYFCKVQKFFKQNLERVIDGFWRFF